MAKKLADTLAQLSQDDLEMWAGDLLGEITDEHVKALQVHGWKIVHEDGRSKWPFSSEETGCVCPNWCQDLLTKKPAGKVLPFLPPTDHVH